MGVDGSRAVAIGPMGTGIEALRDALPAFGFNLTARAEGGAEGLSLLRTLQPRLAVVAAAMPGMDGVSFIRRARALRLTVQPDMLLLWPPGLRLPDPQALAALGAATVDMPPDARRLGNALEALAGRPRTLPPEKAARLEALLNALGVPRHAGRDCLALAVALVWHDAGRLGSLKDGIYPELARQTGLTPAQAERAMRHVIEAAWRSGEIEQQHRIFGDTIDAKRGKPTCGEMIAQLAEELRWEA